MFVSAAAVVVGGGVICNRIFPAVWPSQSILVCTMKFS